MKLTRNKVAGSRTRIAALVALAWLAACGVAVTALSLPASATVALNGTLALTAVISPPNANNVELIWTSSDYTIAEVSNLGVVAGLAPGVATITVVTSDGGESASCVVTVQPQ